MDDKHVFAGRGVDEGDDDEEHMSTSEGCSQTNTPNSTCDNTTTDQQTPTPATLKALTSSTPPLGATHSLGFNAHAAPFVPATAALGPPAGAARSVSHDYVSTTVSGLYPVRRWYCQLLGPVFLRPLDEGQWKEEIERMAQVTVSSVAVNPADGLQSCVTLSSTAESLALYNGRNMSSRNGTWTLVAERLIPIALMDSSRHLASLIAELSSSKSWDVILKQLGTVLGCDVFQHVGDAQQQTSSGVVIDVREGDASYMLEFDEEISFCSEQGEFTLVDKNAAPTVNATIIRVERAQPAHSRTSSSTATSKEANTGDEGELVAV